MTSLQKLRSDMFILLDHKDINSDVRNGISIAIHYIENYIKDEEEIETIPSNCSLINDWRKCDLHYHKLGGCFDCEYRIITKS